MVNISRWKGAHDKFPAHVEEAKNSDGNVHRGYFLLEFRVAAELFRVGPVHSIDDYWTPSDWQLLLVVSEYMSALLEFLDWFWPDLDWEQHKQAVVLSKRLLQPRIQHIYPDLNIDPQLRAAWQSFTYCFWHGTRHLPIAPPSGEPASAYTAAREWLTKLVGERGFEADSHIVSSLQSWIQSTRPRLQEAFPAVDWSRWPAVTWPDPECAYRGVEKRGAIKRRQPEEDYAVRWPLRVTQGRPKFNHLKLEARDGFVVGIPPIKNPPALGFLAVSDVMCAFKQAALHWPSAPPGSPTYLAQQDVVQNFVQNVLRETRGPLAPGIQHEKYRYLGYVACSVLGWNHALGQLALPVREASVWGAQPLLLPGGTAALLCAQPLMHPHHHPQQQQQQHHQQQRQHHQQHTQHLGMGAVTGAAAAPSGVNINANTYMNLGLGAPAAAAAAATATAFLDPEIRVDLGIAAQLAMQPERLRGPETEAVLFGMRQRQDEEQQQQQQQQQQSMGTVAPPLLLLPVSLLPLQQQLNQGLFQSREQLQQQQQQKALAADASTAARVAAYMAGAVQGFGSVPLPPPLFTAAAAAGAAAPATLNGQSSAPLGCGGGADAQAHAADVKTATRPRPSPFARASATSVASASTAAALTPAASSPVGALPGPQSVQPDDQAQQQQEQQEQQQRQEKADSPQQAGVGARGARGPESLEGGGPMSLGGLSSMQDLIDGLPSQADLNWSAVLGEDADGADGVRPTSTASELLAALPSLLLPSWAALKPLQQSQPQGQSHPQPRPQVAKLQGQADEATASGPTLAPGPGPPRELLAFDCGLPCGALLPPPLPPPQRRQSPDAPVHVQLPPVRAASPCQATITTGALPSLALTSLSGLPSAGLSRPELSGTEQPRYGRRSHGEVFTLSPVTSCDRPTGETVPSSPAPATAAAAVAVAAAATATGAAVPEAAVLNAVELPNLLSTMALPSLDFATSALLPSIAVTEAGGAACGGGMTEARSAGGYTNVGAAPPPALPTGGRRTRQDVAAAAAAAAADQGIAPAPGSIVERCAKRPNAQGPGAVAVATTAERVESLGAFLTDQQTGLVATGCEGSKPSQPQPQQQPQVEVNGAACTPFVAASRTTACGSSSCGGGGNGAALGLELLQLVRTWAEEGQCRAQADAAATAIAAAADVHRRAEELLEKGASVDVTAAEEPSRAANQTAAAVREGAANATAVASGSCAGFTPLHWACLRGDSALAELLIRYGADPERCGEGAASGVLPARLVNPGFAAALAEAAARATAAAAHATTKHDSRATARAARSGSFLSQSVFASSAGTVAAQAVAAAEPAALQAQLRNRLAELLRSADEVAAQLTRQDPQAAAAKVLQAMQDTDYLYRCIVSGAAAAQRRGSCADVGE